MAKESGILRALVLQGGGALGAFELGVARVLYAEQGYRPDLIAGVSIGAITAAILARPKNGDPMASLETFWREVTVAAEWLPAPLRRYGAAFGNPRFYMPRPDWWALPHWTNFYDTAPLRLTLAELVDFDALADPSAMPRLLVTATNIEEGQIETFSSGDGGLTLDHILASAALPPGFPMTTIGKVPYWDGGLFDNTPLGAVLDQMDPSHARCAERQIIVVNLFPNKGPVPTNMSELSQRALNLMFANKTRSDLRLFEKFNDFAALLEHIRENWPELAASPVFRRCDRNYVQTPSPIEITRDDPAEGIDSSDFSPAGIAERAAEGEDATRKALRAHGLGQTPAPKELAAAI
jgi:NTE family protein